MPLLNTIQPTRVVRQHLLDDPAGDVLASPHVVEHIWLARGVAALATPAVVTPVGADYDVVLSNEVD